MRKTQIIIATMLCLGSLLSLEAKELTTSLDERVAIKKLSQYWEEKDAARVKSTIIDFVGKYPTSAYVDQLYAMLGDLYFSEKNYLKATQVYAQIREKEFSRKAAFHRLHSLYEIEKFEEMTPLADSFLKDPASSQKEIEIIFFETAEAYRALGHLSAGDKQKELFKKAVSYYEQLQRTSWEASILSPLTALYVSLEDYPKAAATYLRRAEIEEKNREELLFHAASFQMRYDKKAALQTFDRVFIMKGPLAEKAAYNLIVLLFQMERYSDVVMTSIYVGDTLPKEKMGLVHYYAGKALFYEKDFESAAELLEEALLQQGDEELKKGIILTLISCSKETNDLSLCDRMIKELQTRNSDPETLTAALLIHSQLCRNQKEWSIAREDIEKLLRNYPQHKERESLLYDIAVLFMQENALEEGAESFEAFVKEFPTSVHRKDALTNALQLRLKQMPLANDLNRKNVQEKTIGAIETILQEKEGFSREEKKQLQLFLAQTYFHLNQPQQASKILEDYLHNFAQDPSCKEAYLLLAACHQEKDDTLYTSYVEKALSMDPELDSNMQLHRLLFNSYLRLSEKAVAEEKNQWMEKAAQHLFKVSDGSVSKENQRWLAGYYLKKDHRRAVAVLENLLEIHGKQPSVSLKVESEALKLALLYKEQGRLVDSAALLETLIKEQTSSPQSGWKYARMAQFELGKVYSLLGKPEKAIDLYQELIFSSSHLSSYFALAAQLELSKLQFIQLGTQSLLEKGEAAGPICDRLKEVAIKRQLYSEPLHVEAGLHYAEIKSQLCEEPLKTAKKRALLEQVRQELASFEESQFAQFPEKKELINQYLSYIEIELSQLSGESAQKTQEQLHELLSHVYNETLKERVVKNLEELDRQL